MPTQKFDIKLYIYRYFISMLKHIQSVAREYRYKMLDAKRISTKKHQKPSGSKSSYMAFIYLCAFHNIINFFNLTCFAEVFAKPLHQQIRIVLEQTACKMCFLLPDELKSQNPEGSVQVSIDFPLMSLVLTPNRQLQHGQQSEITRGTSWHGMEAFRGRCGLAHTLQNHHQPLKTEFS